MQGVVNVYRDEAIMVSVIPYNFVYQFGILFALVWYIK